MRGGEWLKVHLHVLEGDLGLIEGDPKEAISCFGAAKRQILRLLSRSALTLEPWLTSSPTGDSVPAIIWEDAETTVDADSDSDDGDDDAVVQQLHPLIAQIASRQGTQELTPRASVTMTSHCCSFSPRPSAVGFGQSRQGPAAA
jgi:hypothetical protein